MISKFIDTVKREGLFTGQDRLLLAVSGGSDSVVLAHLLHEYEFNFSMAHCNFKLRGKESDLDEKYCRELASRLGVNIFVKTFDIPAYCRTHNSSIQMAARNLRYKWFRELLENEKFDFILTAHHANDVLETFFINLSRGTGINGLKGISPKKNSIVRPLLNCTKEEIMAYAEKNGIVFRKDKSNEDIKYDRNFIRLKILPLFKKLNPNFERNMFKNISHLREEAEIVRTFLNDRAGNYVKSQEEEIRISRKGLSEEKFGISMVNFLLEPLGFNRSQQENILICAANSASTGKNFSSAEYHLTVDRKDLVIKRISEEQIPEIKVNSLKELQKLKFIKIQKVKKIARPQKNELYIAPHKLIFPVSIRTRQKGDKFMPFGMKGFKLVSDYLKDEKLNYFEKDRCRLLINGNGEVIWVAGLRSDERYKVKESDSDILKIELLER
jgi:tRNA(Ile)-lysidine synthase